MYPPWPIRTALTSNSCPAPESMFTSPASRSPGRTSSSTERDVTAWPGIARCHRHARPGGASPAPIAAAGCGRPGPAACAALSGGQPEVPGTGPRRRAGDGRRPWPRQRSRPGQAVPEGGGFGGRSDIAWMSSIGTANSSVTRSGPRSPGRHGSRGEHGRSRGARARTARGSGCPLRRGRTRVRSLACQPVARTQETVRQEAL